jgi:3-hydroxyisobutyrate dehydrogenase-like beta-hydroxyacid dehydrogenase
MAQADCVVLTLADTAAIRAGLLIPALLAVLRDKTVIQMGTIAQEKSLALQAEIERVDGSYCKAPALRILAEAQFVQWAPLFGSLSREPRLAGPVGKAESLKLALNQLIAAEISAFALSLGLVQRAGVSIGTFMAILREAPCSPRRSRRSCRDSRRVLSESELRHTSSLEGRGALSGGSLRLRTDGK